MPPKLMLIVTLIKKLLTQLITFLKIIEINTLSVENEELKKQIKTLREKLDQRELENENERLKKEVRSLEAKLKP